MTVPTLRGEELWFPDSVRILAFAAALAGSLGADDDPDLRNGITAVVKGHAAISIETLTFSKLLASGLRLVPLVARLLPGLSHDLERRADCTDRDPAVLPAEAMQKHERLPTFTQNPPAETLRAMRAQVQGFLQGAAEVLRCAQATDCCRAASSSLPPRAKSGSAAAGSNRAGIAVTQP
ncbi:MAG: hypothetical protein VKI63_00780 [Cyanobium sp.]|nr:hypothetical protein [Cyanobium sp.]